MSESDSMLNNMTVPDNTGVVSNIIPPTPERCFSEHRGTLYIRIGPMFSGKSTWLDGELTELADTRFTVAKITHTDDVRDDVASCDMSGSTHNSSYTSLTPKIHCYRADNLRDVDVSRYNVIGVDESQFFPDLAQVVEEWVEDKGKHVRVVGLCGDSNKKKFGQTLDLIPICDEIIKFHARCHICLEELERMEFRGNIMSISGPFTRKLGTPKLSGTDSEHSSTSQKDIGGSDKYIAVCRYHHST